MNAWSYQYTWQCQLGNFVVNYSTCQKSILVQSTLNQLLMFEACLQKFYFALSIDHL